jgi:hypothetical protein
MDEYYIRAWVGHLGGYNAGYLIGRWVELPKDSDELNEVFEALQKEAASVGEYGDEFDVFDVETNIKGIYSDICRLSLWELNDLAERFEALKPYQVKEFAAIIQATDSLSEALSIVEAGEAIIIDDVDDERDLGEALFREGLLPFEIPSELESFIDWVAIGRNCTTGGNWTLVESGQAVHIPY